VQILIQHRETRLYLCTDKQWCDASSKAARFDSVSRALEWMRARHLDQSTLQVVWSSPNKGCDWVLWPNEGVDI
jgi:hypothetical protein